MGFQYEIHYKNGVENKVADALSRVQGSELLLMAVSTIQSNLIALIEQNWQQDPTLQNIIQQKL